MGRGVTGRDGMGVRGNEDMILRLDGRSGARVETVYNSTTTVMLS